MIIGLSMEERDQCSDGSYYVQDIRKLIIDNSKDLIQTAKVIY